jgi:hypothetical protein
LELSSTELPLHHQPLDLDFLNFDSCLPNPSGGKEVGILSGFQQRSEPELSSMTSIGQNHGDAVNLMPWESNDIQSFLFPILERRQSIPMALRQHPDCLTRRPVPKPTSQPIVRLIVQTLRSYPIMMLRRETFPPFIHPQWQSQSVPALPVPLANCMSIAQLFASRTLETKPFLWNLILTETKRFVDEVRASFPIWFMC